MDEEALKTAMLMNLIAAACGASEKTRSDSESAVVNAVLGAFGDLCKPEEKPKKGTTVKSSTTHKSQHANVSDRLPTDHLQYAEFVDELFSRIKDKIIDKGGQYVGNRPVLDAVMTQTKRKFPIVPRMSLRKDVLHTILTLADKHQVALLQHGLLTKDVEDRLTDMIIYDIMALYLMSDKAKEFYKLA